MATIKKRRSNVWSLTEAKNNFAAFCRAADETPQVVTVRGVQVAEFRKLEVWEQWLHRYGKRAKKK